MTQCSLVDTCQSLGATSCMFLQGKSFSILKMELTTSSETLGPIYRSFQRHVSEVGLYSLLRQNLTFQLLYLFHPIDVVHLDHE